MDVSGTLNSAVFGLKGAFSDSHFDITDTINTHHTNSTTGTGSLDSRYFLCYIDLMSVTQTQVTPISAITERLEKYKTCTNLPFIEKLPFILELMLDNEFKQNIQKIYLFGSYAYGEPNEDSDIDFCVIIDDAISANRNDVYFKIEKKLLSKHMVPNDLLVYNAGTFDKFKYDRGIERIVITYGVLIYERK